MAIDRRVLVLASSGDAYPLPLRTRHAEFYGGEGRKTADEFRIRNRVPTLYQGDGAILAEAAIRHSR